MKNCTETETAQEIIFKILTFVFDAEFDSVITHPYRKVHLKLNKKFTRHSSLH